MYFYFNKKFILIFYLFQGQVSMGTQKQLQDRQKL